MKSLMGIVFSLGISSAAFAVNTPSTDGGIDPILLLQLQIERIDRILAENSATLRQGFDIESGRSIGEMIRMERQEKVERLEKLTSLRSDIRRIEDIFSDKDSLRFYRSVVDPDSGRSGIEMLELELKSKREQFETLRSKVR